MTSRGIDYPADGTAACLVLAHGDPVHLRRLRSALEPMPVFLHVDAGVAPARFAELVDGVEPARLVQPRSRCSWASFGLVQAELDGYRQILASSGAQHIVVMSGADYPLRPGSEIASFIGGLADRSLARVWPMPYHAWGSSGGLARLRYRHWAWRKHMLRLPVPRPLPFGVEPSGASVWKIISRRHAQAVLDVIDARPDLVAFWRRSWSADETFIPTLLRSPITGIDWAAESLTGEAWWIGWDGTRRKSPPWLTEQHFDVLAEAADGRGVDSSGEQRTVPALFARKVGSQTSTALLDRIDAELLGRAAVRPMSAAGDAA